VIVTASGTAALEMAAMLCEVGQGDEVIMPSYTFSSTANAFVLRGAVPVFVDIRRDTLNIDETLIEGAITERKYLPSFPFVSLSLSLSLLHHHIA
jgi:dTDP-4-amino-4,6-dideoxygalactose transaminase